jgi:CheY-like chemotaxis protein
MRPLRSCLRKHVMSKSLNFENLAFLIADANGFTSTICRSILRGFGANSAIEVRNADDALTALQENKIDLLLCDASLPPANGFALVKTIRSDPSHPFRTIPIVMLMNDATVSRIARARDSGANMVVAKPFSPATLHSRLRRVALTPRKFIDSPNYFGPDRRFKIEGFPDGKGRRAGDADTAVGAEAGPSMSQSDIDNLFTPVKS